MNKTSLENTGIKRRFVCGECEAPHDGTERTWCPECGRELEHTLERRFTRADLVRVARYALITRLRAVGGGSMAEQSEEVVSMMLGEQKGGG